MALQEEFENQGNWLFNYRSYPPIIVLCTGFYIYLRTEIYPETFVLKGTHYEFYYEMFCLFIGLLGAGVRAYTVGFSPKNTSGRNTKAQVADTLNTTGIYSIVRHPLYLGNFLMWLGPAMLTGNFWFVVAFCLFFWVYYERIMFAEEQFLRRKFGQQYLDWSVNVPAFFPRFKNFKSANTFFSWRKVLKKEINGWFALFLIFSLFDIAGELIRTKVKFNFVLIAICVFIALSYIVLKYLKYNTNVLQETDR